MRIDRIRLKNFRCFADAEIQLAPRFNVVVGDNGAGKTALLEGAGVALGAWVRHFDPRADRNFEEGDVRRVWWAWQVEGAREPQLPTEVSATLDLGEGRGIAYLSRRSVVDPPRTQHRGESMLARWARADVDATRGGEDRLLPVVAYYSAHRTVRREDQRVGETNGLGSRSEGYHRWCEAGWDLRASLRRWKARWLKAQQKGEFEHGSALVSLDKVLGELLCDQPGEGRIALRFEPDLDTFAFEKRGRLWTLGELSQGYQSQVALALDLVDRMTRLNPSLPNVNLRVPGVVLVDELDLHLHPRWQRCVVERLTEAFPKVQFIATTHSPHIVQDMRPPRSGEPSRDAIVLADVEAHVHRLLRLPESTGVDSVARLLTGPAFRLTSTLDDDTQSPHRPALGAHDARRAD